MNTKCDKCGANNNSIAKYCSNCGYELPKSLGEKTTKTQPGLSKKIVGTIVGSLVGIATYLLVKFVIIQFGQPSIDKALVQIASEINKVCPVMKHGLIMLLLYIKALFITTHF